MLAKCRFFAYLAIQGRCLTADILAKKKITHNPICALCRIHPETVLHMLGGCSFARSVWNFVLPRFEIQAVCTAADEASLEVWWTRTFARMTHANATKASSIIIATWWTIWNERNNCVFNTTASSPIIISQQVEADLREWRRVRLVGAQWVLPD